MSNPTLGELARFKQTKPANTDKPERKKSKPREFITDSIGLKTINDLVEILGSRKMAAERLGVNQSVFNGWANGDPVRKVYSDLARYIIAEEEAKLQPLLKAQQHTAVVTLPNSLKDEFKQVVEGAGGQYTLLTYPE